jgi:hypothetical protein
MKDLTLSLFGVDPNLELMGWYNQNSGSTTHPVAQKAPNAGVCTTCTVISGNGLLTGTAVVIQVIATTRTGTLKNLRRIHDSRL